MNASFQSCDRSMADAAKLSGTLPLLRPRLVLVATILASSLAFIDNSIVNVGLPAIGRSITSGGVGLSWVVNGYLLPLSALLLAGGAAGDLYGRRRVLIYGIALFGIASLLCAAAPSLNWLIAGRLLQGIGAAMLMPNSLAILGASFAGKAKGQANGTWAAAGAVAGAIGPLLGGWLIDVLGWRAMFFVNLPIAGAAIALARYVPDDVPQTRHTLDLTGAALAAAGLTAMTWGLTVASDAQHLDLASSSALVGGAAVLALFVLVERVRGDHAMVPLALFSSRSFVGLTILTLLLYGALGGLFVLVPYVLIKQEGYSATMAGAALLPLPAVIALASPSMGKLAAAIGPRLPLSIGPTVVAVGFVLLTRTGGSGGYWATTLPALVVVAAGMAAAVAPLTTAVLTSVDPQHTGVASGFNSAVARTGGLVATALISVVLATQGAALVDAFRLSVWIGAAAALAAGASAFVLVRPTIA
jgi:EmrB/QacA subfamily drug resistance transporter